MDSERFVDRHRAVVLLVSAAVPPAVCAILATARGAIENTNAALVLVLIVVGAATLGLRSAGLIAAVSSALSFDLFLTAPYYRFAITDRADIETFVLIVLVGAAVTEVALWGRRQQARASRDAGYLSGLVSSADLHRSDRGDDLERAERQLVGLLGLDRATFASTVEDGLPTLLASGEVRRGSELVDVERNGLPSDIEVSLPVRAGRETLGYFVLTAAAHVARPSRRQRQLAVLLADQVGASLARRDP